MLNYILHNLDRYPLDGVVHFELEVDYPFIHTVARGRDCRWCVTTRPLHDFRVAQERTR